MLKTALSADQMYPRPHTSKSHINLLEITNKANQQTTSRENLI